MLETVLAEEMDVSRAPVREALRQLEVDGLVCFTANQGAAVHTLTKKEIWEIFTARSVIEGYVAALAAEQATPQDLLRLRSVSESGIIAAAAGDLKETINKDFETHRLIWEISGHVIFYEILSRLETRIRLFMSVQASLFTNLFESIREHQEIYQAIANKDPETARKIIQNHINKAGLLAFDHEMESGIPQESFTSISLSEDFAAGEIIT